MKLGKTEIIFCLVVLLFVGLGVVSIFDNQKAKTNGQNTTQNNMNGMGNMSNTPFKKLPGDTNFDLAKKDGKPKIVFVYTNPTPQSPHV